MSDDIDEAVESAFETDEEKRHAALLAAVADLNAKVDALTATVRAIKPVPKSAPQKQRDITITVLERDENERISEIRID